MDQAARTNDQIRFLTPEEARELFDRQARRYLDLSGAEFIRKWDSGEFEDPDEDPEVMRVAMMLPFGRQ